MRGFKPGRRYGTEGRTIHKHNTGLSQWSRSELETKGSNQINDGVQNEWLKPFGIWTERVTWSFAFLLFI